MKKRKKLTTQVASTDIEMTKSQASPSLFVTQRVWRGDCIERMRKHLLSNTVDIVITSPPYNLNISYKQYKDKLPHKDYLRWMRRVMKQLHRVMKPGGSFFLNMGFSNLYPWVAMDVAQVARNFFYLQNQIAWIKSITINDNSFGHFKPINSKRFMNNNFEYVYHFTKSGDVPIDRLANGVPYVHKSNIKRWKGNNKDLRCRGNCWFIPYDTIQSKVEKGEHPAIFPQRLAEMCIKTHGVSRDMVILDPFSGTGTTLVAARDMDIEAIGIELDAEYVTVAKERLKNA